MSLASMTSDVHCTRGLRCARCVFSDSIRTRALCHLRASFDLGVVLGRDPDTGTILGRCIAMFAPPSGELSPNDEICVRMSPDNGARVRKLPEKRVACPQAAQQCRPCPNVARKRGVRSQPIQE